MPAKRTPSKPATRRGAARGRGAKAPAGPRPASALLELAATWPFVSRRYMFGCNVLLGKGRLFFIEMEDSIVLRVGKAHLETALRGRGSEVWNPWTPGAPGDWVSFPPAGRRIPEALAGWARTAYEASLRRKSPPRKRAPSSKRVARRRARSRP